MLANVLASLIFITSIAVGLIGAYFHVRRGILPTGPPGKWLTLDLLVWAPPVLGPLTFSLIGLQGLSAAWLETPPESGSLTLIRGLRLHLPFSKTRALYFLVGLSALASLISMIFDHARTGFVNPWRWFSVAVGIFETVVPVIIGAFGNPGRNDYMIYTAAMTALIILGIMGLILHVSENLIAGGKIVTERFIRGTRSPGPYAVCRHGNTGFDRPSGSCRTCRMTLEARELSSEEYLKLSHNRFDLNKIVLWPGDRNRIGVAVFLYRVEQPA